MIQTRPSRLKMPVDNLLFGAMLALIVFGLWMVFDSSYVKTLDDARGQRTELLERAQPVAPQVIIQRAPGQPELSGTVEQRPR